MNKNVCLTHKHTEFLSQDFSTYSGGCGLFLVQVFHHLGCSGCSSLWIDGGAFGWLRRRHSGRHLIDRAYPSGHHVDHLNSRRQVVRLRGHWERRQHEKMICLSRSHPGWLLLPLLHPTSSDVTYYTRQVRVHILLLTMKRRKNRMKGVV